MRSMPGNPWDGHTLDETIEQVSILADHKPSIAIEPTIGHMKMDGRLARNPLKGALGDALHAVMCGAGHNIRLLLKKLRLLCTQTGIAMPKLWGELRTSSSLYRPLMA
jgi:IS5 family transposase